MSELVAVQLGPSRRALVLPELPLALASEAIVAIVEVDPDAPAAWLPARVFEHAPSPGARRALVLGDGVRFEVPAIMQLVEQVEVLAIPELLRPITDPIGVIGLAVLPTGLTLFCDPLRIAGIAGSAGLAEIGLSG